MPVSILPTNNVNPDESIVAEETAEAEAAINLPESEVEVSGVARCEWLGGGLPKLEWPR